MTPLLFLAASVAGGLGAALRYLADIAIMSLTKRRFPWGILIVNVTGSFALGVVTAMLPDVAFIVGAGLLGGYTTFSTAMLDTIALWRNGERPAAFVNALGMLVVALAAAIAGLALGFAL